MSDDLTHSYDSGHELVALVSSKVPNQRARYAKPPRYRMIPQVRRGGGWNDFSEKKNSFVGMKNRVKFRGLQVQFFSALALKG